MSERWTGPANIAWCAKHGLHGARDRCFECDELVEQIPMVAIAELLDGRAVQSVIKRLHQLGVAPAAYREHLATAALEALVEGLPPTPREAELEAELAIAERLCIKHESWRLRMIKRTGELESKLRRAEASLAAQRQPFAICASWPRRLLCALTGRRR